MINLKTTDPIEKLIVNILIKVFLWCGKQIFKNRSDLYQNNQIMATFFYIDNPYLKDEVYSVRDRLNTRFSKPNTFTKDNK